MSENIRIKLCSHLVYTSFIDKYSKDGLFDASSISFENALTDFLNQLPTYEVAGTTTIQALAMKVWPSESLTDQLKHTLTFERPSGKPIRRTFYCYQYNKQEIPLSIKVEELYHSSNHELVLVYKETTPKIIRTDAELRAEYYNNKKIRHPIKAIFSDFVCESLSNASSGFKIVLIDKIENEKLLNQPFRGLYARYVTAVKKYTEGLLEISFLEKKNGGLKKEHLDYWATKLRADKLRASQFVGDTGSIPYSRKELKQIIPRNIPLGNLPFWLLYRNLDEGHIILTMPEGKGSAVFFDTLIRTFLSVQESITSETYELRKAIETRLQENVVATPSPPLQSPYQAKPGSRARYQEALARAKEQKENRVNSPEIADESALPKGKIRQEDLHDQVDFIFKFEGSRVLSFDNFKEKFLARYPRFLDRRGPRLI